MYGVTECIDMFDTKAQHVFSIITSLKLTACTWKWMVGRSFPFDFGMAYVQGLCYFQGVYYWSMHFFGAIHSRDSSWRSWKKLGPKGLNPAWFFCIPRLWKRTNDPCKRPQSAMALFLTWGSSSIEALKKLFWEKLFPSLLEPGWAKVNEDGDNNRWITVVKWWHSDDVWTITLGGMLHHHSYIVMTIVPWKKV